MVKQINKPFKKLFFLKKPAPRFGTIKNLDSTDFGRHHFSSSFARKNFF